MIYQYCKLTYRILCYRRYEILPSELDSASSELETARINYNSIHIDSMPITRSINSTEISAYSQLIHLINTITACCYTTTTWPRHRQCSRAGVMIIADECIDASGAYIHDVAAHLR